MVWPISSFAHMKTPKNGLIGGYPQETNTIIVAMFKFCQKDEKKL